MFDDLISAAAAAYSVPVPWIEAVIQVESAWNPNAYRAEPKINDASYGLMQLLYGTAMRLGYSGDAAGLYDPATNINLGAKLLGQLRTSYGDDFQSVYSAYNSGNPNAWLSSSDVAQHVANAVAALASYADAAAAAVTQSPVGSAAVFLLGFALLWLWGAGRPKKGKKV